MKHLLVSMMCILLTLGAFAQVSAVSNSKWQEEQTIVVPKEMTLTTKTSSKGNVHYYLPIDEDTEVLVSDNLAKDYVTNQANIILVKWKNISTNSIRYSTRTDKKRAKTNDIDLTKLYK